MFDSLSILIVLLLGKHLKLVATVLLVAVLAYFSTWFAMFMAVCACIGWFSVDPEQYRNTATPKYTDADVFGD